MSAADLPTATTGSTVLIALLLSAWVGACTAAARGEEHVHVQMHENEHEHVHGLKSTTVAPREMHATSEGDATLFCEDVCAAGLGAPRCGAPATCAPARMRNATAAAHLASKMADAANAGEVQRGRAREELCPKLCPLQLGNPLCHCVPSAPARESVRDGIWRTHACEALCSVAGTAPRGCPACQVAAAVVVIDWDVWCHVLCKDGDGGLACLCDVNP